MPVTGADGTSSPAKVGLSGWPLLLLLAATQLVTFSDRFLLTLVAEPVKRALALSDAQLGLLQGSAFALLYVLALPVAGTFADGGHRRTLLLASIAVSGIATFACGLGDSFVALVAGRLALGLGQAGIAPAALSLMAYRLERGWLGVAVSFLTAGGSLGRSLALLGGGAILAWLTARGGLALPGYGMLAPWQGLFVLAALPHLALALAACRIVEPPRRGPAPRARTRMAFALLVRRRSRYLPFFVAAAAAVLISQTLTAWAPIFYVRLHGLTPAESGVRLGGLILFATPVGHLGGGRMLDRLRAAGHHGAAAWMLTLGLLLAAPATALMVLAPGLAASLTGFTALVTVLGATSPAALAGLQLLTPISLRGQVSAAFISGVTLVGLGTGPFLLGLLSDVVFGADGVGRALLVHVTFFIAVGAVAGSLSARRHAGGRVRPDVLSRR